MVISRFNSFADQDCSALTRLLNALVTSSSASSPAFHCQVYSKSIIQAASSTLIESEVQAVLQNITDPTTIGFFTDVLGLACGDYTRASSICKPTIASPWACLGIHNESMTVSATLFDFAATESFFGRFQDPNMAEVTGNLHSIQEAQYVSDALQNEFLANLIIGVLSLDCVYVYINKTTFITDPQECPNLVAVLRPLYFYQLNRQPLTPVVCTDQLNTSYTVSTLLFDQSSMEQFYTLFNNVSNAAVVISIFGLQCATDVCVKLSHPGGGLTPSDCTLWSQLSTTLYLKGPGFLEDEYVPFSCAARTKDVMDASTYILQPFLIPQFFGAFRNAAATQIVFDTFLLTCNDFISACICGDLESCIKHPPHLPPPSPHPPPPPACPINITLSRRSRGIFYFEDCTNFVQLADALYLQGIVPIVPLTCTYFDANQLHVGGVLSGYEDVQEFFYNFLQPDHLADVLYLNSSIQTVGVGFNCITPLPESSLLISIHTDHGAHDPGRELNTTQLLGATRAALSSAQLSADLIADLAVEYSQQGTSALVVTVPLAALDSTHLALRYMVQNVESFVLLAQLPCNSAIEMSVTRSAAPDSAPAQFACESHTPGVVALSILCCFRPGPPSDLDPQLGPDGVETTTLVTVEILAGSGGGLPADSIALRSAAYKLALLQGTPLAEFPRVQTYAGRKAVLELVVAGGEKAVSHLYSYLNSSETVQSLALQAQAHVTCGSSISISTRGLTGSLKDLDSPGDKIVSRYLCESGPSSPGSTHMQSLCCLPPSTAQAVQHVLYNISTQVHFVRESDKDMFFELFDNETSTSFVAEGNMYCMQNVNQGCDGGPCCNMDMGKVELFINAKCQQSVQMLSVNGYSVFNPELNCCPTNSMLTDLLPRGTPLPPNPPSPPSSLFYVTNSSSGHVWPTQEG
eukprot:gene10291-8215_t